jgi:isopenicillin N synthase-like dioxygenase
MPAPGAVTAQAATDFPKLSALPIINIDPYLATGNQTGRMSVAAALHAACLEYGFFYLDLSSYIDPSEPEELTRLAREFFALPQEEKEKIALRNQDHARGEECYLGIAFGHAEVHDSCW